MFDCFLFSDVVLFVSDSRRHRRALIPQVFSSVSACDGGFIYFDRSQKALPVASPAPCDVYICVRTNGPLLHVTTQLAIPAFRIFDM